MCTVPQVASGAHKYNAVADGYLKPHFAKPVDYALALTERSGLKMINLSKQTVLKNLSIALEKTRWGLSISQPEVSEKTGITQAQLSNYEHGKALPSIMSIIALADLYDVSIDYLLGRCQNRFAHKTFRPLQYKHD